MRLWAFSKLAKSFREGQVSEREQFLYVLANVLVGYTISDTYLNHTVFDSQVNQFDLYITIGSFAVAILGTWICYRTSQNRSEQYGFIARYFCLGIPVAVQVVVYMFVLLIAVFIFADIVTVPAVDSYMETENTTVVDVVAIIGIEIIYFFLLNKAIDESYA